MLFKPQHLLCECVCVCVCVVSHSVMSYSLWPHRVYEAPLSMAPLSMGFSRQEYWSGLPFSPPEDLPDPGIEPASPALAGGFCTASATWEAPVICCTVIKSNPDIQKCGFFSD